MMLRQFISLLISYRTLSAVTVALIAFVIHISEPALFVRLAQGVEDYKYQARVDFGYAHQVSPEIAIVTVDEPSVNRLGRWPWDRAVIADLLARIEQASIVSLDIVFSETSNPTSDDRLAEVVAENENIILGFFFRDQATEDVDIPGLDSLEECAYFNVELKDKTIGFDYYEHVEVNIPQLASEALSCSVISTTPDSDGLYRHYPLAFMHKDRGFVYPTMAVQILRYYYDEMVRLVLDKKGIREFSIHDIKVNRSNNIRLNFPEPDMINYISAVDVISGKITPDYFKDKIVIVGVTEIGIFDMRPTPVDPVTPGVSLHYTAVSNLLQGDFIDEASELDFLLLIVVLIVVVMISLWRRQAIRLVAYGLLILMVIMISYATFFVANLWLRESYIIVAILSLAVTLELFALFKTDVQARELKRAFSSYVSGDLVEEIIKEPGRLQLGGEEREISVLFSDIRGFTSISEKLRPQELVSLLNHIHDPLTAAVLNNRGMLDKYIGDAMMALFNAPLDLDDHADRACASALAIMDALEELRHSRQEMRQIDIGIGVNTGMAVVGNMGSKTRFEYTAIGDSVNLASRLEGLNKVYRTHIIVSEFTRAALQQPFLTRLLDRVRVKGKQEPVAIYELMVASEEKQRIKEGFEQALAVYSSGDFAAAERLFAETAHQGDPVAPLFVERCRAYQTTPPDGVWDGVHTLTSK